MSETFSLPHSKHTNLYVSVSFHKENYYYSVICLFRELKYLINKYCFNSEKFVKQHQGIFKLKRKILQTKQGSNTLEKRGNGVLLKYSNTAGSAEDRSSHSTMSIQQTEKEGTTGSIFQTFNTKLKLKISAL
jgi:hypothetical protein